MSARSCLFQNPGSGLCGPRRQPHVRIVAKGGEDFPMMQSHESETQLGWIGPPSGIGETWKTVAGSVSRGGVRRRPAHTKSWEILQAGTALQSVPCDLQRNVLGNVDGIVVGPTVQMSSENLGIPGPRIEMNLEYGMRYDEKDSAIKLRLGKLHLSGIYT